VVFVRLDYVKMLKYAYFLSSFCPPGVVGLSKAARHNFMVQLIAKLGSKATGCAAFFEKSNEMARYRFPNPFSNSVHEADFCLNEWEGGAPLLCDFTMCKHVERSGALVKVVPKPFEKAAKRKLEGEPWKHYTRANNAPGFFKPLVMNWFGGVGPEFSSLLSEFAESELERSSGFAKLKVRLKPSLREQQVNGKKRRYLAQLQCLFLDLSGQALSAHRSGVLAKRGPCRFWSENKNSLHFWNECPVEQISRPNRLGGFHAFDAVLEIGVAAASGFEKYETEFDASLGLVSVPPPPTVPASAP